MFRGATFVGQQYCTVKYYVAATRVETPDQLTGVINRGETPLPHGPVNSQGSTDGVQESSFSLRSE